MFNSSYKIATLVGIPIKVHISLLLLVILFISRFGPLAGLGVGLGLLVSIVLHELGHSLVALRKGCKVREITLLCVGGAAQMERKEFARKIILQVLEEAVRTVKQKIAECETESDEEKTGNKKLASV